MSQGLGFINFYLPAINFILFIILFYFAFRSVFSAMAKKQRQDFFKAKEKLSAEKILAEKKLDELLYKEQELSKRLHGVVEQAKIDAKQRANQIIEEAKLKSAQILEESNRLIDAQHQQAINQLKKAMIVELDQMISSNFKSLDKKKQNYYLEQKLDNLKSLKT